MEFTNNEIMYSVALLYVLVILAILFCLRFITYFNKTNTKDILTKFIFDANKKIEECLALSNYSIEFSKTNSDEIRNHINKILGDLAATLSNFKEIINKNDISEINETLSFFRKSLNKIEFNISKLENTDIKIFYKDIEIIKKKIETLENFINEKFKEIEISVEIIKDANKQLTKNVIGDLLEEFNKICDNIIKENE